MTDIKEQLKTVKDAKEIGAILQSCNLDDLIKSFGIKKSVITTLMKDKEKRINDR